jgi:hypothetical protein
MSRHRSSKAQPLPKALVRLIHAARKSTRDSAGSDITGVADALRELGELALWALPVHGVFVPNNNDVAVAITEIANEYLGLKQARGEFGDALSAIEVFENRDPIESASNHLHTVLDAAYYPATYGPFTGRPSCVPNT